MGAPRPLEETLLSPADEVLTSGVSHLEPDFRDEARLQILEAAASRIGGFDLACYQSAFLASQTLLLDIKTISESLVSTLRTLPIHPSLALSSLAQPSLSANERRSLGVYYTDFRLAEYLTRSLSPLNGGRLPLIVDPSSGTGILLVAAVLKIAGDDRKRRAAMLERYVCAADQSSRALRGAALALASLTDSKSAIESLIKHLRHEDSLRTRADLWRDIAPDGFDVCIGNPPWEKLKISRHEFLSAKGAKRHYGAAYENDGSVEELARSRKVLANYTSELASSYALQGSGEHDLYKLFLELAVTLTRPGGHVLLLVPAGLIRSLGTKRLRRFLLDSCSDLHFTILENRARFFAIDTRFKFLAMDARLANGHRSQPIELIAGQASDEGVTVRSSVKLARSALLKWRPDLSIPEVRTPAEWKIFEKVCSSGNRLGAPDGDWQPTIVREVDMTQDRENFREAPSRETLPLMEGRMIHQFRHGAKEYAHGTGRSAVWNSVPLGKPCRIRPQFWYPRKVLSDTLKDRVAVSRVGFCDITGQTNERTLLAARIPSGVVCGNKVPTILFRENSANDVLLNCWLAIANSISFDWVVRRVVTTTVNFFLLLDLPFPQLDPLAESGLRLAALSERLSTCDHDMELYSLRGVDPWEIAEYRAEIEWRVLQAYGLDLKSLELMFDDFPLMDRAQPAILSEGRSTITRDFVLLRCAESMGEGSKSNVQMWKDRVELARAAGAIPYIPSHLAATSA